MKRFLIALVILSTSCILFSCSRSVTPDQAASNHYGHCRDMR